MYFFTKLLIIQCLFFSFYSIQFLHFFSPVYIFFPPSLSRWNGACLKRNARAKGMEGVWWCETNDSNFWTGKELKPASMFSSLLNLTGSLYFFFTSPAAKSCTILQSARDRNNHHAIRALPLSRYGPVNFDLALNNSVPGRNVGRGKSYRKSLSSTMSSW